jgi:hypothetical protein
MSAPAIPFGEGFPSHADHMSTFSMHYDPDNVQSEIDQFLQDVRPPPLAFVRYLDNELGRLYTDSAGQIARVLTRGIAREVLSELHSDIGDALAAAAPDLDNEFEEFVEDVEDGGLPTHVYEVIGEILSTNIPLRNQFLQDNSDVVRANLMEYITTQTFGINHYAVFQDDRSFQKFVERIFGYESIMGAYLEYEVIEWANDENTLGALMNCVYYMQNGSAPSDLHDSLRVAKQIGITGVLDVYRVFIERLFHVKYLDFLRDSQRVPISALRAKQAFDIFRPKIEGLWIREELRASMQREGTATTRTRAVPRTENPVTPFQMHTLSSHVAATLPDTVEFGRNRERIRSKSAFVRDYMTTRGVSREHAEHKYDRAVARLKR